MHCGIMEIRMSAEGFEALERRLQALTNGLDRRVDIALGQGAARMQGAVKALTPVDTGNLRNKIILQHPQMYTYTIESNVEYALFVEFGTGQFGDPTVPHTNKESWTYYSEALQRYVTTKGQKPAHMFTQGFQDTYKEVFNIVKTEIRSILQHG